METRTVRFFSDEPVIGSYPVGKERGFLEYRRKEPEYRPASRRIKDYKAVELQLAELDVSRQAARCMDCGIPFCHASGCPLANLIPEFNEHAYQGRWKEALDILLMTDPFPEFTGRICPAPCEASCVLDINDDAVTIRQIELAIIETGFEKGYVKPTPPVERRAERVAVIGSGPAGLVVAEILNKAGYNVVVYENAPKPGGILRYGIPDFKLEKWVVDRRIQLMEAEGVVFETGVEVGADVSHRYLETRFDAIVLTGGASEPRDLHLPGRDLKGIHFAMDYLVQQNRRLEGKSFEPHEEITAAGKRVVVIGGGDTGSDCMGTAIRQGPTHLTQLEILLEPPEARSEGTPWPMWPLMRRDTSSHKEGGERRWSVMTEGFVGENGQVRQLRCAEVEWVTPHGNSQPVPRKKPGTEFTVDADLVLLAMGFVGPGRNSLLEKLGIDRDRAGFVCRDDKGMTTHPGVFVAGDMTLGASLVVRAMADGKKVASSVMEHLSRKSGQSPG